MKAINAKPQSISEVFTGNSYGIPGYQRRYEWDLEQCEQMWEDFIDFNNTKKDNDKYFFGSIVVEKTNEEKVFNIVDGQQRITTITLLLAAIFSKASTHKRLEKILKKVDSITDEATDELRLKSYVIDEDANSLNNVVFGDHNKFDQKNKFFQNFKYFEQKVSDWIKDFNSTDKLMELIKNILDNIILLPIECESTDDALVLFNTLNGRGLQLTDSDIFKAQIYASISEEKIKKDFISRWNKILSEYSDPGIMTDFFRIHMHVIRAKQGVVSKEKALRTFYYEDDGLNFLNYPYAIEAIEQYASFDDWSASSTVNIISSILDNHNNHYWKYPLFTFLATKSTNKTSIQISLRDQNNLEKLLVEILKFMIIKGVVWNSVNVVKDLIFKVCAEISNNNLKGAIDKLKHEYKKDGDEFLSKLNSPLERRYIRTIVITAAYLDAKKNPKNLDYLSEFLLTSKFDIEHILPKKWNNYDGWNADSHIDSLNTIGNLVLLDRELNISASNEFFERKKDYYRKSKISSVQKLANHSSQNWKPEDLQNRTSEIINAFNEFL